jgi:hypothetical protein
MKSSLKITTMLIVLFYSQGKARFSIKNNVSPLRGIIGLSAGVIKPFGGNGQVFGESDDTPHGDYGFTLGLDYWKKNLNSFEYHIGFKTKFVQHHFHHTPEGGNELTGYFQQLYYAIPFALHLSVPQYKHLQVIIGAAAASMNTLGTKRGNTSTFSYSSKLDLRWMVSPELFAGVNFIEEKTDALFFKGSIIYAAFPARNLSYTTTLEGDNEVLFSQRRMWSGKIELLLTFYPKWKSKKTFGNDEGINCPTSF